MDVHWDGLLAGQLKERTEYDHFINIDGIDFHYRELPSKKKNAHNILLLHGFAASTYTWEKIDYQLNDAGYYVWSLDMKGFGWSDKPRKADYSPEALMTEVNRWMDYMGLEDVTFVGNSYGGGLGILLAFSYPRRIKRLVLIDAGGLKMKLPLILRLIRLPFTELFSGIAFGKWMVKWLLKQVFFDKKKVTPEQIDNYYSRMITPGATNAQVELAKAIDFDKIDLYVKRFSEMTLKTMIIWGENDPWIPLEFGYSINRLIKDSLLVILPECGHIPQEERPDDVLQLLLAFIQGKDPRESFYGFKEQVFKVGSAKKG